MTKIIAFASLLLALPQANAWLPNTQRTKIVTRWAANSQKTPEMDSNPCWEDLYDDDCVMENDAAAGFVAAQWIKSMPCGEGIEVNAARSFLTVFLCRPTLTRSFALPGL